VSTLFTRATPDTKGAYEASIPGGADPAELLTQEFTNQRERIQAPNLCHVPAEAPAHALFVRCG